MRDPQDYYAGTWTFLRKAKWTEEFAWLPHQCRISRRWIWLKKAYRGVAIYNGPGYPVTETHWHESGEHIKWVLTKPDNLGEFMSDISIPMIRKAMPSIIAQDIIGVQSMQGIDPTKLVKKDKQ
jgi:hypothetical protein